MIAASMNARAEKMNMPAWSSWKDGRAPDGWFRLVGGKLPEDAASFFREFGFLVVENALDGAEVQELRDEALAICKEERGVMPGATPGMSGETDEETMRRYLCIHFPHKVSEIMERYLSHPSMVESLTGIIGPNVKCMQSMLFIKAAGKPGQAWHQDEIYIPTRDRSLTGGWIAMDDATVENGCLWVIPGSQKPGVLYYQAWHGDSRFDCALEAKNFPYASDDAVPVEVRAGSIVFFNGYLLHRSLPNYATSGFRRCLVNHYMSAESLLPWFGGEHPDAVSIADHRDITMIAGTDPYAWKGTELRHGPHVRASGEGGCGNLKYNEDAVKS